MSKLSPNRSKRKYQKHDIWNEKDTGPGSKETYIAFTCSWRTRRAWTLWLARNNRNGEEALRKLMEFRGLPLDGN